MERNEGQIPPECFVCTKSPQEMLNCSVIGMVPEGKICQIRCFEEYKRLKQSDIKYNKYRSGGRFTSKPGRASAPNSGSGFVKGSTPGRRSRG